MSSVVLLLFLCFSVHACNARLLGFIDMKSTGSKPYDSVEDVGKVLRLSETSKSSMRPTISVESQAQVETKSAETIVTLEEFPKAFSKKKVHADETTSGHDFIKLSPQIDGQKSIKMKGLKRHARTLLGSATHDMEEDKDPKGNEAMEDVGVMDYAQPHRKPPIHNEKS